MNALIAASALAIFSAPNVVLLSADTLRADRLGFYGYEADTSPNLDALAADSLVFDNAICEVPLTSPSFCSMLSSQYPRVTGTTRNGLRLPAEIPVVSEVFQRAGYETFCVQSNWTLKNGLSGLGRGFDVYDDGFKQKRWGILKSERDADDVTDIALDILENRDTSKPFFGWFHYSDPHAPYKRHWKFDVGRNVEHIDKRTTKVSVKYDSEIAFTDHHIQRLLDALPKENTIILFVGDHGESIYEHDYLGHGRHIYQPELRIPLFIHGAGIEPGRTMLPARGIDIGPTLLRLADLPPTTTMMGLDLLSDSLTMDRVRVVETYGGAVPKFPGAKALMANKPPQRQSAISGQWKLILGESTDLLFDIVADPLETRDVLSEHPQIVEHLNQAIVEWSETYQKGTAIDVELSEDDIEALHGLGYIE